MYKKIEEEAAAAAATALLKKKSASEKANDIVNNSRTLFIVFPTLEEFAPEREVLSSTVLPELQAYCCDRDIDLECSTFFSSNFDYGQLSFLLSTIKQGTANVLVFIGDKYGDALLPLEITQEEFNAIQSAALEFSKDVKLLEQCYFIDKTKQQSEYRLKDNFLDPNTIENLRNILQQGSKRAKDDGVIHQINEERQLKFYQSFIEVVANAVIESQQQHFFVIRKFQAYETTDTNDRWMEVASTKLDSINSLKNRISSKVKEGNYLPYICNIHGYPNPQKWFENKDSDKYKKELTVKLSSTLKTLLNISSNLTATIFSYSTTPMEAALREHATHEKFAEEVAPKSWIIRNDIDKKINTIVEQSMTKLGFYQFYGPAGCGKTAFICRLAELFRTRNCYVITRFCYLTDCSLFVNELFRNILLKFHEMAKISSIPMMSAFHLLEILNHFKFLAEKVDRPLILLLDDVHLLKFGKALSVVEKAIKKKWPQFSMIVTATNANVYLHFLPLPENIEMPLFSKDQIMEILKSQSPGGSSKTTNYQLGLLRQKIKKATGNIILAEIQYDELCEGQPESSADLEARLFKIESKLGVESVRIVCQLLCVLPYGLTALEVADGFRLSKRNSGLAFDPKDVLSPIPYMVLKYLGRLLVNVYTDRRRVWLFRHSMVAQIIRQRYLPSAGEVKLANETMAELLASVPSTEDEQDPVTSNLVFPQPINRENGSVNMRRIRYQWYYLLHAGKLEQLKEITLCLFNYLEACFRGCGIAHLLSIFEECSQQILDHDILVLFEQVLLPAIPTLIRDKEQFVCELLNRLRFTSSKNSERLNTVVEQLMTFADTYNRAPLLLPLTCWISPPKMKQVVCFAVPQWKSNKTVVQPTHNHQHLLISGNDSAVGQILMYHLASTLLVRTFTGHTDRVTSICTSHDGQFFTSASHDGTIKLWNFANPKGENFKTLNVCKAKLICSLLSNDDKFIVVGSTDSTARVITIESGAVERAFKDHTGPVVGLQLSSDNTLLVTGSGDFVVMVWDIQVGEIIIKMSGLMAPVTCLAITSNDAFLTVACEDETVRVFSMVSSQELHELTGHEARVNALAASADDCQLFAATKGKILCYDIHNGQLLETLDCGSNLPVTSLKITDDNSFVLASCGDKIHMWNMNSIKRTAPHNEKSKLSCVKLAPDERSAACGTVDSIIAFWDLDLCRCLWSTTPQKNGKVTTLDFTPDSSYVLSGTEIGQISMWDVTNGFLLKNIRIHDALLMSICCFFDGNRVLSCDQNGLMHIWNIYNSEDTNGVEVLSSTSGIRGPLYLNKNDSVLIGYNFKNNKEMQIWSIVENKLTVKTKVCHNEEILCYCANKFGTVLVTGSMDQSLKIWQVDSGFLTQILVGHDDVVTCCCVSEDGKLVVSGGQDKHIYIWDVQVGAVKRSITAKSVICAVQITQDNSVVLSADQDGWIEAWSSETSRMLSSFNTHRQIMGITVSTDASRILVLLNDTAQLPILCLHNTPANMTIRQERRTKRIQSASSYASNTSELNNHVETITTKTTIIEKQPIIESKKSPRESVTIETNNNNSTNGTKNDAKQSPSSVTNTNNSKPVTNFTKKSTFCTIF